MSDLIYLASPYSHQNAGVRFERFRMACEAAGRLIKEGHSVISPIAHSHPIATICGLPLTWHAWQMQDVAILSKCDEVVVLRLDGWEDSKGIKAELTYAHNMGIPIRYIDP